MKRARLRDYWDKLEKVVHASNGVSKLVQISEIGDPLTFVAGGVCAIVGANGSGKTSFFDFLTKPEYSRIPFQAHAIELARGDKFSVPANQLAAIVFNPLLDLSRSNKKIAAVQSTFGQNELAPISDDERGLLNYVLASDYKTVSIEEIEVEDDETLPRFVLEREGMIFDNENLSLGEQAVLFLYWFLSKRHPRPGIFFIEEPESGLSPLVQGRLVDMLVYLSACRAKQLFISTHSPFIVSRLGKERVVVMTKGAHASWRHATDSNYLNELGMDLGKRGIIYVEDHKAKIFLTKLLDLYGSNLRKTYDVVFLGGESHVYEVIARVARKEQSLKVLGILDADQKGEAKYATLEDYLHFLPGELSPEEEVILAVEKNLPDFARAISANPRELADVLRRLRGRDHHDFFEDLSRDMFGEVRPSVYESAFGVWYHRFVHKDQIHDFIRRIDSDISEENIAAIAELYG